MSSNNQTNINFNGKVAMYSTSANPSLEAQIKEMGIEMFSYNPNNSIHDISKDSR